MDADNQQAYDKGLTTAASSPRRLSTSGQSLLYRLPFLRPPNDAKPPGPPDDDLAASQAVQLPTASTISAPQRTRRRRGSLRKAALLGRGARRDEADGKHLTVDIAEPTDPRLGQRHAETPIAEHDALGLRIADLAHSGDQKNAATTLGGSGGKDTDADQQANQYTSTTDEEDVLQIPGGAVPSRPALAELTSGSDSYFANRASSSCSKSFQQAKSPLSYSGISSNPMPQPDADWDYSETAWWGWVVLSVTWFVFVIGMGSCLDIWSWAWDVGKTPYAPPELEDDPTLPIVGYYPALIILTCVMAWVWVVVAWVGMKYFRHAKISGD